MLTFADLLSELASTGIQFAAFAWGTPPDAESWGVLSIDSGISLTGDNTHAEDLLEGTIDLYTRALRADAFNAISAKLRTLDLAYRLNSVQYESDTRLLHYEWVWQGLSTEHFE